MIETKIYIGLNDATTKQQKHSTETYVDIMKYVCKSYHVPFAFSINEGGYFHENGDYTQERILLISLMDADKQKAESIAKDLCAFFHQESVMVTESVVSVSFIKDDLNLEFNDK
ncbi:MAG: hypothetical protein J5708_08365 [Bacteroidales bacterium]|nr:hypothetical protein [Bacteroidales bacterium]